MAKKEKNKASQKHQDKNKNKAKSHNSLFANIHQPQTQASKKNKHHESYQKNHSTTRINAIEVAKKDKNKNKAKDLSDIDCYIYKQKGYYANKCPKKTKN